NREAKVILSNPPAKLFMQDCEFETNEQHLPNQLPIQLIDLYNQVIVEEKEVIDELQIQGKFYVIIITPLYDNENIRGAVAIIRDMTEERQLDKLRQDFIANVSHELRTPIAMLQGYSEAIVDDIAESTEDKNELAQIILDESLRMGRLVNELLDIGRMEAGQIDLHVTDNEIKSFFQKIMTKFQGMANEKNIDLALTYDLHDGWVQMDGDRLEQVCTNLIANALQHTKKSGEVTVHVSTYNE